MKMGARLEAANVTVSRVEVVGWAVRDEHSTLTLTSCMCHKHSRRFRDRGVVRGVHAHTLATAALHDTTLCGSGMCCGVDVAAGARATLAGCTVKNSARACVQFRGGGTGRLQGCEVSGSRTRQGLCVQGARLRSSESEVLGLCFTPEEEVIGKLLGLLFVWCALVEAGVCAPCKARGVQGNCSI